MKLSFTWIAGLTLMMTAFTSNAEDTKTMMQITEEDKPFLLNYANLDDAFGRVLLSNENVVVQRLVVPAGEWEGIHSHPGHQLYVHIKGGYWSGKLGDEFEYEHELSEAGTVGWMDHIPFGDGHNSGNSGEAPIDLIYVTSKSGKPLTPGQDIAAHVYPNIALEVKFENDLMIAQRGTIEPGQWSGVYNQPGNQLYILVEGGTLSERSGGEVTSVSPNLEDGSAKWLDAAEAHEFGNTGDTTIDFVLVTFK